MKTRRVLGAIASIGIVIGGAVAAPAAASAKAEKVDVCHDGDYGWELINVSVNALDAHLRHGDGVPGGEVPGHSGNYFADDCLSTYGDVVVTLEWYGINDQDLHVIEPSGEHIYWSHPTSANGGQLDQDDNPDCVDETPREHQETVTWPAGASPLGDYDTYVDVWSQCGTAIETWTLTVEVGGVTVVQETGNTDPSATYSFANPS